MRFNKNRPKLIFLFPLILIFSTIGVSQTEETSEVVVPEQAMEQVVRRILIWHFKPRKQPKIIYLAAQEIQKSWLPAIKNIKFRLLSDEKIKERKADIYFFTKPEKAGDRFSIVFGFGDPDCSFTGNEWYFRLSQQKVRLWSNGEIGGGCSSPSYGIGAESFP